MRPLEGCSYPYLQALLDAQPNKIVHNQVAKVSRALPATVNVQPQLSQLLLVERPHEERLLLFASEAFPYATHFFGDLNFFLEISFL